MLPITGEYPVVRSLCASMWLYINIDVDTRFQFNGDAVIPDGYLLDPAFYQCFVKFGQMCRLVADEILQLIDAPDLLVTGGGVHGALLFQVSKS